MVLLPAVIFAQQVSAPNKFALVIGNGNYSGMGALANPVNDARDMAAALESLGFTVERLLDANLEQMESAVTQLKNRLSVSGDTYGFFFYAGHGVQSYGENYLIPADANIPSENYLRNRAVSVQLVLDELNDARNSLNVVVLDACRDNPFGWSRSGSRGLAIVGRQPADSIIVYATSAGQRASDGDGRNGLFTSQLLPNLKMPGIEVKEIFNRTGADVAAISGRQQIPAVYNQFFGTAYLGSPPEIAATTTPAIPEPPNPAREAAIVKPSPMPLPAPAPAKPKTPKRENDSRAFRLNTVGLSLGSSFAAPVGISTLRGTFSPARYSFAEIGVDVGIGSGRTDIEYTSILPYAHYAFFMPFAEKGGLYAGAGGGYMFSFYNFPEGDFSINTFAASFTAGVNLLDAIDISYTLRTDFATISNKLSVGWVYRFK